MCEHLQLLEKYIKAKNISEIFRGKAWDNNCNEWAYFDCVLDVKRLKIKFNFDHCMKIHDYIDYKVANELGFVCETCKDGIMGLNPKSSFAKSKVIVE